MTYRRICAWCVPPRDLGPAPAGYTMDTHGICPECARGVVAQLKAGVRDVAQTTLRREPIRLDRPVRFSGTGIPEDAA